MQLHLATVFAFKDGRDFSLERQTAAVAERRLDKPHFLPAGRTNETLGCRGVFMAANLAGARENQTQPGIKPRIQCCKTCSHIRNRPSGYPNGVLSLSPEFIPPNPWDSPATSHTISPTLPLILPSPASRLSISGCPTAMNWPPPPMR